MYDSSGLYQDLAGHNDYVALIDHGVRPCRPLWLTDLQHRVADAAHALDFPWIFGTNERGSFLSARGSTHMNGNAVYSLAPEFRAFVNQIRASPEHSPLTQRVPRLWVFDVALSAFWDPNALSKWGPSGPFAQIGDAHHRFVYARWLGSFFGQHSTATEACAAHLHLLVHVEKNIGFDFDEPE
eukprot:TRINITY_DN1801_c0_g1_i13.p2 TRINITY_DN1801_c0_g1~~TRINITY_DN1801_c0_g1_i13.p2  ORF type:complete len:183 (-),score=39.52 TRINITY_DN1801_c0_g1_i13:32-580(-)